MLHGGRAGEEGEESRRGNRKGGAYNAVGDLIRRRISLGRMGDEMVPPLAGP